MASRRAARTRGFAAPAFAGCAFIDRLVRGADHQARTRLARPYLAERQHPIDSMSALEFSHGEKYPCYCQWGTSAFGSSAVVGSFVASDAGVGEEARTRGFAAPAFAGCALSRVECQMAAFDFPRIHSRSSPSGPKVLQLRALPHPSRLLHTPGRAGQ